ncbi:MAG: VWA domain-containing protein [Pseudomonadota bacterium]
MTALKNLVSGVAIGLVLAQPLAAACSRDAIMVFDGSGSMATPAADPPHLPRIDEARSALGQALPDVTSLRRVGLMVYGPGPLGPCDNVEMRVPPTRDALAIMGALAGTVPEGDTPLTKAVRAAANALTPEGIIVLITDGRETCGGGTCALAADLAASAPGITVHVIGFKVWENFSRWPGFHAESGALERQPARCMADETGGLFISTDSVEELVDALRETLGCAVIGRVAGETLLRKT